ncbi:MAG: transposase [Phocaeicola sp.]
MAANNQVHTQFLSLISFTLDNSSIRLNKWRRDFILEVLMLFLSIPGRINFLQLGRYSSYGEQRFRQQFDKEFDFMTFNSALVKESFSGPLAIAIDPSYIPKSGKKIPYMGSFWSGCAQSIKRGLEIMGVAALDIQTRQALHLEAVQTPPVNTLKIVLKSLLDWYSYVIEKRKDSLLEISNIIIADAYFAKHPFVDKINALGFHLISRLPNNASLRYLFDGEPRKGKGRPRKYEGAIDVKNIDMSKFSSFIYKEKTCYYAVVNSIALKRDILIIIEKIQDKGRGIQRTIFSTDTHATPEDILDFYHARFQIEFLYRDAKQATGLNHSQARSLNKLNAHFNYSLTAVNIAKTIHWRNSKGKQIPFSIKDTKMLLHNQMMVNLFISRFGVNPNSKKNHKIVKELLLYGVKTA